MENKRVIGSNVLKHDVPPILEGSTDGTVSKSCVSKRHPCHSYTQGCTTFALLGRMHMNMDKRHVTRICIGRSFLDSHAGPARL